MTIEAEELRAAAVQIEAVERKTSFAEADARGVTMQLTVVRGKRDVDVVETGMVDIPELDALKIGERELEFLVGFFDVDGLRDGGDDVRSLAQICGEANGGGQFAGGVDTTSELNAAIWCKDVDGLGEDFAQKDRRNSAKLHRASDTAWEGVVDRCWAFG